MSILCALVAYGTKILTEHTIDTTKTSQEQARPSYPRYLRTILVSLMLRTTISFLQPILSIRLTLHTTLRPDDVQSRTDQCSSFRTSQCEGYMIKNVGEILNRGERIELLLDKTDNLSAQSSAFRKRSQVLRRKMWWKNTRMIALSALVVVMVIYILLAQACGANLSHCSS
ncbi:hypothetical protein KEM48_012291 [Puccinia striiformis f. sp. tritici PST-130]|nr:hypothetical protein KEM48_012291 [Puccinia striiformis f. sp. tritici PST-130]